MADEASAPANDLEGLLRKLEEAKEALLAAIAEADAERFEQQSAEGESIKLVLERTGDDLNFYYGRLIAQAVSLPQPPCLPTADFLSLREAAMALQVAHRRLTNLLHDLVPADLEREATDEEHGPYTLRQLLELAAAHYRLRADQVRRLGGA